MLCVVVSTHMPDLFGVPKIKHALMTSGLFKDRHRLDHVSWIILAFQHACMV
jgi:hypothetical protein